MSNFSLNVKINGADQAVSSVGEIEEALKATRKELKGVEIDSSAFAELSKQARILQDQLKESFKEATNFDRNLGKLGESVTRLGSSVAGSFSLITSAFQLFGDESEELSQAQIKAQQALAIAFSATTLSMNAQKLSGDLKLLTDRLLVGITKLLTVATNEQTAATTALSVAMRAIPLLAIIAGIGALTGAISSYNTQKKEAIAKTKEFAEAQKLAKEETDKQNKAISDQSSKFVSLLLQLKNTNAESKERLSLINQINEEYGLTLDNLSDERDFQQEINLAIDEYIDLQRIRFNLINNQEKISALLAKELELNTFIARDYKIINDLAERLNITFGDASRRLSLTDKTYRENLRTLEQVKIELNALGVSSLELNKQQDDLTEGGKKYTEQNKKTSKTLKEQTKDTNDLADANKAYFDALEDNRQRRLEGEERELQQAANRFDRLVELADKAGEDTILITEDYQREVAEITKRYGDERIATEQEVNTILNSLREEITFGDQNVTNTLISLTIRRRQLEIDALNNAREFNKLRVEDNLNSLKKGFELEKENLNDLRKERLRLAEVERIQQLENTKEQFKKRFGLEFFETEKGKKILQQLETNLETEKETKLLEINAEFNQKELDLERQLTADKIALAQEVVDFATNSAQLALDLFTAIADLARTTRENELIDLRNANDERLNTINEQYNAELQSQQIALDTGLINQQQYNQAILALDTDRTQAQAGLENKLRESELKAKKKSFEDEKKLRIASTVIAGVQGSLQAFAGAFQLGPIAGPIVGGILAALVGATTGIQVAAIKKQKFDSSGSVNITPPNPSGAGPIGGLGGNISAQGSSGGFTQFNDSLVGTPTDSSGVSDPTQGGNTRVYVLESDITATQNRVSVAETAGTIG